MPIRMARESDAECLLRLVQRLDTETRLMTHNRAAVALYEKVGFAVEGTRQGSMLVDGFYVDEYYMAKLLD